MTARPAPDEILDLTTSYIVSSSIQALARLRVADQVSDVPRDVAEIAHECQVATDPLRRVLRLLASRGVFREDSPGMFVHTPLSETLRADHPNSMRAWAQMTGGPIFTAFSRLLESLRTGGPAFASVHGAPPYDYLKTHHEDRADFAEAMGDWNRRLAEAVLDRRDFSAARKIVDVGGSYGFLLGRILERQPNAQGIILDLPEIAPHANLRLKSLGLDGRCTAVGGNFFESIPDGGDVYLMSWILHNWNDEDCLRILRNIRRAIPSSGRLLNIDHVIQAGGAYDFGKVSDLAMLVTFGGRERTEGEFNALFKEAGFRLLDNKLLDVPVRLLEAEPI